MQLHSLPEDGQFLADVGVSGEVLSIRLVPEALVRANMAAYVIGVVGAKDLDTLLRRLASIQEAGDYVYVRARDCALLISSEDGEELEIQANGIEGSVSELTADEFRQALTFWSSLYDNAHIAGSAANLKISCVRGLVSEQLQRTIRKSEGKAQNSGIAVVYAQHAQFLERLLKACGGDEV